MSSTRGSEGGAGSSKASGPATGKVDGVEIDITTAGAGTLFVQQSYVSARDNAEVEGEDSRGASAGAGSDKSTKKSGASGRPLSRGGRIGRSKAKELMDDYKRAAASSASTSRSRGRRRTRDWDEWPPSWEQVCAVRHPMQVDARRRDLTCQEPEEALDMESPDLLLERGIADYTFLPAPGGLLGKGKFSTVYKVIDSQGRYVSLLHDPRFLVWNAMEMGADPQARSQAHTPASASPSNSSTSATRAHSARPPTYTSMPDQSGWMDPHAGPFLPCRHVSFLT
jgi:hypothetical protein